MTKKNSLEAKAKTKYTIQNKKGQQQLTAHEYMIERYMDRYWNRKNT